MISDNGSQFIGAERLLKELIKGWDIEKLREFSAEKGLQWQFTTPASPHQNGCAEALVKSCKMALKKAIGEQVLTPFEFYTCLLEVANLVNQRPIGRIPNDPDDGSYLCPNDILLGRSSAHVPQGPFRETNHVSELNLFRRLWTRFGSGGQGIGIFLFNGPPFLTLSNFMFLRVLTISANSMAPKI